MATEYAGYTAAELARVAERTKSNVATVKRWIDTLGLAAMTVAGAAKAIKDAKAQGTRPNRARKGMFD